MTPEIRDEIHELLSSLADDRLDSAGQERLGRLLADHPEARTLYLRHCELHAQLAEVVGTGAAAGLVLPTTPRSDERGAGRPIRRFGWSGLARLAAVLVVGVGLGGLMTWSPTAASPEPEPLGRVETPSVADGSGGSGGAGSGDGSPKWSADSTAIGADGRLRPGSAVLESGRAVLTLRLGAELTVAAPARLQLLANGVVRLESGRLTARVPEGAVGLRIVTPTAELLDLGTEFGVAVDEDGDSEMHVFRGMVVARSRVGELAVPVVAGEGCRIGAERGDFAAVAAEPARFPGARSSVPARGAVASQPTARPPLPPGSRVVFLGGRVTDRETYLLLTAQALADSGRPGVPRLYNAAVAVGMNPTDELWEKYVSVHRPTHAVLMVATELAVFRKAPPVEEFAAKLAELVDRTEKAGIVPILATGYPPGPHYDDARRRLVDYNRAIRGLAAARGCRLADVAARFEAADRPDRPLAAEEDYVPTFEGAREIAASVLEALGFGDVPVAPKLRLALRPGVIRDWKLRQVPADRDPTDEAAAALVPDDGWTDLQLPMNDRLSRRLPEPSHSVNHQHQAVGYAHPLHFSKKFNVEGVAWVESDRDKTVWMHTGATLKRVWINGEQVFDNRRWTGWHAGKERVAVKLKAGSNRVVIWAHDNFFLSLTDDADFPVVVPPAPAE